MDMAEVNHLLAVVAAIIARLLGISDQDRPPAPAKDTEEYTTT